ncbi:hypothetical protein ACP70R_045607 [Stipagrostis hirtigluma subsp. patula]
MRGHPPPSLPCPLHLFSHAAQPGHNAGTGEGTGGPGGREPGPGPRHPPPPPARPPQPLHLHPRPPPARSAASLTHLSSLHERGVCVDCGERASASEAQARGPRRRRQRRGGIASICPSASSAGIGRGRDRISLAEAGDGGLDEVAVVGPTPSLSSKIRWKLVFRR